MASIRLGAISYFSIASHKKDYKQFPRREYQQLGGSGNSPMAHDYSHWHEGEFDNEVMTSAKENGERELLSGVTIGAL